MYKPELFICIVDTAPLKIYHLPDLQTVVTMGGKPGWAMNVVAHPFLPEMSVHVFLTTGKPKKGERMLLSLSVMASIEKEWRE
jgi:hypothetical protein